MSEGLRDHIAEAAGFIREQIGDRRPRVAIVLGSALGHFADRVEGAVRVRFADVPHMLAPAVVGHAGEFVVGTVEGLEVVVSSGRVHGYEGHSLERVTFGVRVMAALGVETLVLTNASGGINSGFAPGDLMVIDDHLNLLGNNPLRGPNDDALGPRFPDMTEAYDASLREALDRVAESRGIHVRHGVYAAVLGPSYETPAEVRMLRTLGADAVGMSTVPETIVARHAGLRVAGISCITNAAAGLSGGPLVHDEVIDVGALAAERFGALLSGLCGELKDAPRPAQD